MKKQLSEMTVEELWKLFPIILTEHAPVWSNYKQYYGKTDHRYFGGGKQRL